MTKLNCQRHECTKAEEGVTHLLQFSILEEDLEVTEDVYEVGAFVRVSYQAPSRVIVVEGVVEGFEFVMDVYEGPYVMCNVIIEEEEEQFNV